MEVSRDLVDEREPSDEIDELHLHLVLDEADEVLDEFDEIEYIQILELDEYELAILSPEVQYSIDEVVDDEMMYESLDEQDEIEDDEIDTEQL